ncbi:hypothetical protein D9M68_869000 [compost metagenome]
MRDAAFVALAAQQHQRQRDVLRNVQVRQHVEGLEHEAHVAPAPERAGFAVERADVDAAVRDRARVPAVEPGHAVEQRRLAGARFAHDGDELAGLDAERHVLEDGHVAVVLGEPGNAQRHAVVPAMR